MNRISIVFIVLLTVILSCRENENIVHSNSLIKLSSKATFDTLKIKIPKYSFSKSSELYFSHSILINDSEYLVIANSYSATIHIIDIGNKVVSKTIKLNTEGPESVLSSRSFFYAELLHDFTILVIDPKSKKLSRIDTNAFVIARQKLDDFKNISYYPSISWSTRGGLDNSNFYFPIAPEIDLTRTIKESSNLELKYLLKYDLSQNKISKIITRNNYPSLEKFSNISAPCLSCFIAVHNDNLYLSDCTSDKIYIVNTGKDKIKSTIDSKSSYFKNIKVFSASVEEMNANYSSYITNEYQNPCFLSTFIDTKRNILFRHLKHGLSDIEFKENKYIWGQSFILIDLFTQQKIGELTLPRKLSNKEINFLEPLSTSIGILFPFANPQSIDEEYFYFLRMSYF